MHSIALAVVILLAATSSGFAQPLELQPDQLKRYETVRLRGPAMPPGTFVGKVTEADSTRLLLRTDRYPALVVPLELVEHVDVLAGRNRVGPAFLGFAAGALALGLGYKLYADATVSNDEWNGFFAVLFAAPIGGLLGATVGAVLGSPNWDPVRIVPRQ